MKFISYDITPFSSTINQIQICADNGRSYFVTLVFKKESFKFEESLKKRIGDDYLALKAKFKGRIHTEND
jgi:hypothetical protein